MLFLFLKIFVCGNLLIWHERATLSNVYLTLDNQALIQACLFSFQLMGEEPDLDPEITREFFEKNVLQFDPSLLTENGMK